MLRLVGLERWVVATISRGFQLWHVNGRQRVALALPSNVRNVSKGPGLSSVLLLSARSFIILLILFLCILICSTPILPFVLSVYHFWVGDLM